jgi:hypothetical protein
MITEFEVFGGLYGDSRPDGEIVVCMRGQRPLVRNNGVEIPLPPNGDNVLFPRIPEDGPVIIAGQGSQEHSGSTWEWDGTEWHDRGFAPGTLPVIYDLRRQLHIAAVDRPTSQGYRAVERDGSPTGKLIFGDDTLAINAAAGHDQPLRLLHEYTQIGDLLIGQDHDSGAHIVHVPSKMRYVLTPGDCRFILARYDAGTDILSIVVCRFDRQSVHFYWMHPDNVGSLDVYRPGTIIPPPVIVPPPSPGGSVPPDESALARATFLAFPDDITTLRAKCDETDALREQFGEADPRVQAGEVFVNNLKGKFTRRIVWACAGHAPQWGLLTKTTGALATRSDGVTHATDIAMWKGDGSIVDVMSDRNVAWGVSGEKRPLEQWIAPLAEDAVEPPPNPNPTPTPDGVMERVTRLEAVIVDLKGSDAQLAIKMQALQHVVEELAARVDAIRPGDPVDLKDLRKG